jgi:hypothetical protein
MRMADLVQEQKPAPLSAMKKSGYVPPHLRKTASFPETPASVASLDTSSKDDFPTLGSTPKSGRSAPVSASWTQIRSRFHGAAATGSETPATPATAVTSATAATNQFAALDEDASIPATPKTASSFKQIIKDRVKREHAERIGMLQEEPTDPQLMTQEQLERQGWAVLPLPPSSATDAQGRAAWFANYAARAVAKELARDKEFEALCEIYAPAGTVEPELRKQRLAVDPEVESVGYEPEEEHDHAHEVEVEVY